MDSGLFSNGPRKGFSRDFQDSRRRKSYGNLKKWIQKWRPNVGRFSRRGVIATQMAPGGSKCATGDAKVEGKPRTIFPGEVQPQLRLRRVGANVLQGTQKLRAKPGPFSQARCSANCNKGGGGVSDLPLLVPPFPPPQTPPPYPPYSS